MNITQILAETQAVLRGKHFVYSGGDHGEDYINLRVLKEFPDDFALISYQLLEQTITHAKLNTAKPLVVVGPETLGAMMAKKAVELYQHDNPGRQIASGYFKAIEVNGKKEYMWGDGDIIPLIKGAQVIWIDDLMDAGSTLERTRMFVENFGTIVAVAVIADRSDSKAEQLRIPHFEALLEFVFPRYSANMCPLCAAHKPIVTSLGYGKRFQEINPDYPGGFIDI